eukprot:gene23604-31967_t
MRKIYNRCNFVNCLNCALFRFDDSSSNQDVYCVQHRQPGMVAIYEMCERRDCHMTANYRLATDLSARFCMTHAEPGMERVYLKLGESIEKSIPNNEITCAPCFVPQSNATQLLPQTYAFQSQVGSSQPTATSSRAKPVSERGRGRPRLSSTSNSQSNPCEVMGCTATSALPIFVGLKNRICRFCRIHMKMVINKSIKISHKRGQKPYIRSTDAVEEVKSSLADAAVVHYDSDSAGSRYPVQRYCVIHRSPEMNVLSAGIKLFNF